MAVTADYDPQSAVERELVLRLASLLWRLRRATAIESGLFEIQAKHLLQFRQRRQAHQKRQNIIESMYRPTSFSWQRSLPHHVVLSNQLTALGHNASPVVLPACFTLAACSSDVQAPPVVYVPPSIPTIAAASEGIKKAATEEKLTGPIEISDLREPITVPDAFSRAYAEWIRYIAGSVRLPWPKPS